LKKYIIGILLFISFFQLARFTVSIPPVLPIDDAYIVLSYARNVTRGHVFAYNEGQLSSGITSPAYALTLAAIHPFFADWHQAVVVHGWISFILAVLFGVMICERLAGTFGQYCFLAFFGCSGHMAYYALFGMEPIMFIAFALGSIYMFISRRRFLAGLFGGVAFLCRPEAIFLIFLMGVFELGEVIRAKKGVKQLLLLVAGFVLFALPWMVYCWFVSRTFFSSTVHAKLGVFNFKNAFWFVKESFFLLYPSYWENIEVANAVPPTLLMKFMSKVPLVLLVFCNLFFFRKNFRFVLPLLFIPLHVLIAAIKNPISGEWERYMSLDFALVFLYSAVALGQMWIKAWQLRRRSLKIISCSAVSLSSLAFVVLLLNDYAYHIIGYQGGSNYFYHLDYSIGQYIAEKVPKGARVALFQAGGIKYFGDCPVIDLGGVTDHTIWPYLKGRKLEALVDRGADYVASFGDDWLTDEGVHMSDARFFTPEPIAGCRGFYKVNKEALAAFVRKGEKPTFRLKPVKAVGAVLNGMFHLDCPTKESWVDLADVAGWQILHVGEQHNFWSGDRMQAPFYVRETRKGADDELIISYEIPPDYAGYVHAGVCVWDGGNWAAYCGPYMGRQIKLEANTPEQPEFHGNTVGASSVAGQLRVSAKLNGSVTFAWRANENGEWKDVGTISSRLKWSYIGVIGKAWTDRPADFGFKVEPAVSTRPVPTAFGAPIPVSVAIRVQVIPKLAEVGTNHVPWNIQVSLCQQSGGGEYTSISNAIVAANNDGQINFCAPVQLNTTCVRTYRVTCMGGGVYNDEPSSYLAASEPAEYNVSLNMRRK
jgi:hypothetical protein